MLCSASTVVLLLCSVLQRVPVLWQLSFCKESVNQPHSFCYVCGEVTFKSQRKTFTPLVKNVMNFIFGAKQVT